MPEQPLQSDQFKQIIEHYIEIWELYADHVLRQAEVLKDLKIPNPKIFMNSQGGMNESILQIMLRLKYERINAKDGQKINWSHNVLLLNHFIDFYEKLPEPKLPISEFDFNVAIKTYTSVIMET